MVYRIGYGHISKPDRFHHPWISRIYSDRKNWVSILVSIRHRVSDRKAGNTRTVKPKRAVDKIGAYPN